MNRVRNYLNRIDTIFNRMIASFVILVVLVVLIIGGILTIQFSYNYNRKIEELEQYRLEYLEHKINNLFEESNRIIQEITSLGNKDKELQSFLYHPMKNDFFKAVNLLEYLQILGSQNDSFVSSLELYVQNNDVWISTFTGINYTEEDAKKFKESLDIFESEVQFQGSKRWISDRIMKYSTREIPVYSVTSGYPLYTEEESRYKGYVIVNIRKEVLQELLRDYLTRGLDAVAIINSRGDIVDAEGNVEGFHNFMDRDKKYMDEILANKGKKRFYTVKDHIIMSQSVAMGDWTIVNLISTKEYFDETRAIQTRIVIISLLVVLLGIVLSYCFARKLYQPFNTVMTRLMKAKLDKKARESEYYYIDRAMEELCDKADEKEKVLNDNKNIIKSDFVVRILTAKLSDRKSTEDKLKFLGYYCDYPQNHVLMIKIHPKIYENLDEMLKSLIIYNMINYFDNYKNDYLQCLSADLFDGKVCVIVSEKGSGKEELKALRNKFTDYMKMNFSIDPIILQSSTFKELGIAHEAYLSLLKLSEYVYFLPRTYFIDAEVLGDRLERQRDTMDCHYETFSEALVTRDIEIIRKILKDFIDEASMLTVSTNYLNGAILKYLFIYNYFMRDIMKGKDNETQHFTDVNDQYDVEDFYYWFLSLIENTFDELDKVENNPSKTVAGLIEKVIMENLGEELSLEFIAEKVFLSPKYISRLFKDEKGINITQFITDCKLKKAAKLLIETNMPLDELIKKIGFGSSNYFIKKFKEKYSVTPVQYRRNSIM
ncbi:AraC family transcriptional regulator [Anaerocolumna xylanovorans]|uniref:AraC-type DNA-binding protein n=1 Tax=Anaerocolumna xylanovorans DSM 12503 TaxID=1121345 RepID=A0A1M7YJY7_9FIRM|nr:helix-turn-helix domain-containing protein [Anaerocolumna xylanovorans]SHO52924.1 AraC-type DNA-binding protein [Anaerocolumna xylanovorans DSM 12503]